MHALETDPHSLLFVFVVVVVVVLLLQPSKVVVFRYTTFYIYYTLLLISLFLSCLSDRPPLFSQAVKDPVSFSSQWPC